MADDLHDLTFRTLVGNNLHAYLPAVSFDWTDNGDGASGSITFLKGYLIRVPDGLGGTVATAISAALPPRTVIAFQKRAVEPFNGRLMLGDCQDSVISDGENSVEMITYRFVSLAERFAEALSNFPTGDVVADEVFTDASPGLFIRQQTTDAAARGALTGLSVGFTNTEDSALVAWESMVSRTVLPGSPILAELRWLRDKAGATFFRMAGNVLTMFNAGQGTVDWTDDADPGNTLGRALHLHAGRDLADGPRQVDTRGMANRVLVLGDEDRWVVGEDAASIATYGPLEVVKNAASVVDEVQLQVLADLYAAALAWPRTQIDHSLNLGFGQDPLDTFNVGDTIYVRDVSAVLPYKAVVRQIRVSLSAAGTVSCDISTGTRRLGYFEALDARIAAILDGSGEGARPSRNALPPAAPTAPTYTLAIVAPVDAGDDLIRFDLTGFSWSGLDADGAPCGDLAGFPLRWKFGDKGWSEIILAPGDATARLEFDIPHAGREVHIQLGARDKAGNTSWGTELT